MGGVALSFFLLFLRNILYYVDELLSNITHIIDNETKVYEGGGQGRVPDTIQNGLKRMIFKGENILQYSDFFMFQNILSCKKKGEKKRTKIIIKIISIYSII